jgi:hypothetical protein
MKKLLLSIAFIAISFSGRSQIMIANDETPAQLIVNTFIGQNMTINNIKFNNSNAQAEIVHDQMGRFSNGVAGLAVDQGLILSTGNIIGALGPNDSNGETNPTTTPNIGDADLAAISLGNVQNAAIVEFDFIPNGNTVLFEYIFASEEYPFYVNTAFNDTFGLFLSGPGINGPYSNNAINIATIPGTSLAVSINNLNNGNTNTGPCENCEFYIDNGQGTTPEMNTEIQYNGHTTELTATGSVTPGQTYHLKFAIGNVADNAFDSAMFLTAGSFRSQMLLSNPDLAIEKIKMYRSYHF